MRIVIDDCNFGSMARNYKKSPIPTGAGKLFEPLVIFIRDEIAIPNIGPKYHKYISYLLTIFFFILFLNVFGLLPFGINVTGNLAITAALAILPSYYTVYGKQKLLATHLLDARFTVLNEIGNDSYRINRDDY